MENQTLRERLETCEADSKIVDWLEQTVFNGDVTLYVSPLGIGIVLAYRDDGTHSCVETGANVRDAARAAVERK